MLPVKKTGGTLRRELLQNYYSKPAKARIHAGFQLVAFAVNYGEVKTHREEAWAA